MGQLVPLRRNMMGAPKPTAPSFRFVDENLQGHLYI
jgi:hypothetical protein